MEIDEGVITVGQAVYLVSEFTLTPVVDVVDRTVICSNSSIDTLHNS